ncbi:cytochrome c [Pseudomonas cavernae]|uniref:Cytochrome c n=1 Tax=Pseudomonas cavernae TaxID=2320867 RepID=A0A385Z697_9PSED|nr:cytochrome c [Pseudomonas cavernae]AYC33168.1 cytochrome c [Pseudomonas cavernae]
MKRTIKTLAITGTVTAVAVAGVVYAGLVNVGADDPHFAAVHALLATARDRSIEVRARNIEVPNLNDEALIRAGAGNYNSMCIGCHLAPGVAETELSQSLYPAPPNLTKVGVDGSPSAAFWIIKHGIKSTGMPAWGKSMSDPYIWGIVAFLQQLPTLDAEKYRALVASSGGHQHGGGETKMHNHEGQHGSGKPASAGQHGASGEDHHAGQPAEAEGGASHHDSDGARNEAAPAPKTHTHADGKEHVHEG